MSQAHVSQVSKTRRSDGRVAASTLERQAQSAARSTAAFGRGGGIRREEAPGVTGPGRPLAGRDRARMERRLGRDFSAVRVHSGSAAAEAVGAKAFAYGRDIVFGPGQYDPRSSQGSELLAHELAHVGQQAEQGAATLQRDPKAGAGKAGGIGSAPPDEAFEKATDVAIEDSSVLFDLDKASLSAASQKALVQAMGNHKGPVTVQIDGYASNEGQGESMAEYNLNLSAHRAAKVKAFLMGKLPAGSKFTLRAHGESTAFAPLEQNRRVGITIRDGVAVPKEAADKTADAAKKDAGPVISPWPPVVSFPKITGPIHWGAPVPQGPYLVPPLGLTAPPLSLAPTYSDIDWESFHNKAAAHGLKLDDSLSSSLESNFSYSYHFFLPFLGHEKAISASNFATNYAFSDFLERENPNAFDRFQLDFKKTFPNEKHLVIPLIGSDTLDYIRMKIKGNKKDDYFFRFNLP